MLPLAPVPIDLLPNVKRDITVASPTSLLSVQLAGVARAVFAAALSMYKAQLPSAVPVIPVALWVEVVPAFVLMLLNGCVALNPDNCQIIAAASAAPVHEIVGCPSEPSTMHQPIEDVNDAPELTLLPIFVQPVLLQVCAALFLEIQVAIRMFPFTREAGNAGERDVCAVAL